MSCSQLCTVSLASAIFLSCWACSAAVSSRSRRVSSSWPSTPRSRACAASRSRRQARSTRRTSGTPSSAFSRAKCTTTSWLRAFSNLSCSCLKWHSSLSSRSDSALIATPSASALLSSSLRTTISALQRLRSWAPTCMRASNCLISSWRTCESTSPTQPAIVSISWSRSSISSSRFLCLSRATKSKGVRPSFTVSVLTAKLPSRDITSPSSVTSRQPKPCTLRSSKTKRRPSSRLSAITTSPRRKLKMRA
mmetsp:Transcript_136583/g.272403  ORF Transcript_136583/g.272403 Transcript_136583/m.272403 type:complete len:250 (-) Transcript_136583:1880-2629(-)